MRWNRIIVPASLVFLLAIGGWVATAYASTELPTDTIWCQGKNADNSTASFTLVGSVAYDASAGEHGGEGYGNVVGSASGNSYVTEPDNLDPCELRLTATGNVAANCPTVQYRIYFVSNAYGLITTTISVQEDGNISPVAGNTYQKTATVPSLFDVKNVQYKCKAEQTGPGVGLWITTTTHLF